MRATFKSKPWKGKKGAAKHKSRYICKRLRIPRVTALRIGNTTLIGTHRQTREIFQKLINETPVSALQRFKDDPHFMAFDSGPRTIAIITGDSK
jgi:hypothetical protein